MKSLFRSRAKPMKTRLGLVCFVCSLPATCGSCLTEYAVKFSARTLWACTLAYQRGPPLSLSARGHLRWEICKPQSRPPTCYRRLAHGRVLPACGSAHRQLFLPLLLLLGTVRRRIQVGIEWAFPGLQSWSRSLHGVRSEWASGSKVVCCWWAFGSTGDKLSLG